MYKQRIDVKSMIFCQIEQTGLDTATAHLRTEKLFSSLNFYFCFYSVVNYTDNYFWDFALFLNLVPEHMT